ncbi:MAG: DNA translocase FtsK 4TM domain-containing protein, partial [Actinomycetota bacterium]
MKTPPKGNRRPESDPTERTRSREPEKSSAARRVVEGREVEFWGVGLVSLGILLVLSMYLQTAGPLGEAIDTTFGWLLGLGRFLLPAVSIGIGVALVRRRSVEHRLRLTVGWTVVVLAALGLLHLANGADSIVGSVDAMSNAGGWFGALLGEPLRTTVGWAGTLVILLAVALGGTMLITDTTLPELVALVRKWITSVSERVAAAREERERNRRNLDDLVEVPGESTEASSHGSRHDSDHPVQHRKDHNYD